MQITEAVLKEDGWKGQLFEYKIGGGEDEDDMSIWIKGKWAITKIKESWLICRYDNIDTINGWDYDGSNSIKTVEELKALTE